MPYARDPWGFLSAFCSPVDFAFRCFLRLGKPADHNVLGHHQSDEDVPRHVAPRGGLLFLFVFENLDRVRQVPYAPGKVTYAGSLCTGPAGGGR